MAMSPMSAVDSASASITCSKQPYGGMPVLFGPNNKHFAEAQGLLHDGGGLEVCDLATFTLEMDRLADDERISHGLR